jgi:hypothetical protein
MLNFVPSTVRIVPVLLEMVKPVEEGAFEVELGSKINPNNATPGT